MPHIAIAVLAALLVLPASASAAFNGSASGDSATLQGSDATEVLVLTVTFPGGLLNHGRKTAGDPGFESDVDWDSIAAGEQTVVAANPVTVTVNLGGGDDALDARTVSGALKFTANGGLGNDALFGTLTGDTLRGDGGDDRITPVQGNDTAVGGEGSDRIVWENGHGSDVIDGEGGFDFLEVSSAPASETFSASPNGPRTRLERTAPGAFTLDVLVEAIELRTGGGDDTLNTAPGVATSIYADGGEGNDALNGGDAADVLRGGPGADALTGGLGSDALIGGDGDDAIGARDGQPDLAVCGDGNDGATLDRADVDTQSGCERLDVTPTPTVPPILAPAPGVIAIGGARSLKVSRNRVRVTLSCSGAASSSCRGELTVRSRSAVRIGRVRSVLLLGRAAYSLKAGVTKVISIRLPANARRLAKRKRLAVRIVAADRVASKTLRF